MPTVEGSARRRTGEGPANGGSVFENRIASPRRLRKPQSIQLDAHTLFSVCREAGRMRSGACPEQRLLFEPILSRTPVRACVDETGETGGTPVQTIQFLIGEFDPGSERTLTACLTHASRARMEQS